MRPSRRANRTVRHLHWRVRIFGLGAVLALVGIYLDLGWLVNVALGVLVLGFALRFLPEADEGEADEGEADQDEAYQDEAYQDEAYQPEGDGADGGKSPEAG